MATRKLLICTSALLLLCFTFLLSGCGGTSHPSEETPPPSQATAAPTIASISPASVTAGSVPLALHVTGTGFVSGSVISFNGTSLQTTYVSSTQLSASVPASLLATSGSFSVAVVNPDGQKSGGSSGGSGSTFSVDNGQPTITALTPSSIPAGSAATDVVVAGTNFISSSIASFGGSPRPTKIQGATQLTVSLTASDLTTARTVDIVVTNPAPGGGTSAPSPLTITTPLPPAPVLTSLSPSSAVVGSPDTTVILTGTGFTPNSQVVAFGLTTSGYVSPTTMTATMAAYYLSTTNTYQFSVLDSGRRSNSLSFAVVNPVPVLSSISPSTVTAGAPDFNLVLQASGIVSSSQIMVNGAPRDTFTGNGGIAIRISASEVAEPGSLDISIVNPEPGGGTSATLKLSVIAGENRVRTAPVQANALTWDPKQQRIYAAVSASATSNASSVVAIDPATGGIVASQQMSAEPTLLSITDDQQFLYVGMKASAVIARLKLPSLTPDIQWNAGASTTNTAYYAGLTDLQAAPGLTHTVAAAQQTSTGGKVLAIYDDGVMRPLAASAPTSGQVTVDTIQWGADAGTIYGSTLIVSGGNELTFSIDNSGSALKSSKPGVFAEFAPFFYDRPTGHIYDPAGDVIDPATGRLLGKYAGMPLNRGFAIDSTLHRAYYMSGDFNVQYPHSAYGTQIDVFDQNQHNFLSALYLDTGFSATDAGNLIRWGAAGLAFTSGSTIYIIDGPFVAPGTAPTSEAGGYAVPAPVLSSLSPEFVPAGSPDTVITLSGQGFSPSTLITWSGNIVASTMVNSTTMQVTLPAASLATPGAGLMVAANDPNDAQSNPLGFTVTPNLGSGMHLRAINVSGSDLVWNAAAGLLYASVPATDLLLGNTIASIDPVAGVLKSVMPTASDPFTLAISADNQLLYAGFAGATSVERYALPAMTPDLTMPLGIGNTEGRAAGSALSCGYAVSIKVAPGSPQTIAVTQGNREIDVIGCGPVVIFDGSAPRSDTLFYADAPPFADFSNLIWGPNDSTLYAQSSNEIDVQYISALNVAASGVTLNRNFPSDNYLGWRAHFDLGTGLIYSDGGAVTNPVTGLMVGNFMASGLMVPDSKLGRAYFLGRDTQDTDTAANSNALPYTLQIYDLKTFTLLDSIKIPSVIGYPEQMVRWGTDGIAFTTRGYDDVDAFLPGLTYIVSGVRITGAGGANPSISQQADHVQMTWQPGAGPHKQNLQSSAF